MPPRPVRNIPVPQTVPRADLNLSPCRPFRLGYQVLRSVISHANPYLVEYSSEYSPNTALDYIETLSLANSFIICGCRRKEAIGTSHRTTGEQANWLTD